MPRPRLLFVYLSPSSFVEDDRALLAERYDVRAFHFDARAAKGARGMAAMLARQAAWLRRELPGADAVYGWFADYHMALPVWAARRAGVPVAIALGGFEANTLPALGYGVMLSRWRAPLARYVLRNARVLLPVAEALIAHENRFGAWPDVLRNGVRAHVPRLKTPHVVVPTGYDAGAWAMGPAERSPSVLAVGFVADARGHRLKGLDHLLAAAGRMPDVAFRAVGVAPAWADALRARGEVPSNAELLPPRARADLAAAYAEASVFACLSRSEGQPNVLCEAMLCGCVPVGSAVGGIPEVIGDAGFVAGTPEPAVVDAALRAALAAPPAHRSLARARIEQHFSRALRRARLFDALAALAPR